MQQSIFNGPPVSTSKEDAAPGLLKPSAANRDDHEMEDAKSPASVAGVKRRREDEDDGEEDDVDSEGDAAMEEDSDDE